METSEDVTVISSWLIFIAAAMREAGVDVDNILLTAGIEPSVLNDPDARINSAALDVVYQAAVKATGDHAFGLRVATFASPSAMHAIGYSLFASSTLLAFFERLSRFFRMLSQAGEMLLVDTPTAYHFSVRPRHGLHPARGDALWAVVLKFVRMVYRANFAPERVTLLRPDPGVLRPLYEDFFCCPVVYGGTSLEMLISRDAMATRLRGANSELVRRNDQIVIEYLARFDSSRIVPRVQTAIIDSLPEGHVTIATVAGRLNLSSRTVQRELENEGTSFHALYDEIRKTLALSYLKQGHHSIKQIAFLLGYHDSSNFSRAFRRLTGVSPMEFREHFNSVAPTSEKKA